MSYHITEKETTGFTLLTLSWHIKKKKHTVYLELYDISVVFHYKNCLFFCLLTNCLWFIQRKIWRRRRKKSVKALSLPEDFPLCSFKRVHYYRAAICNCIQLPAWGSKDSDLDASVLTVRTLRFLLSTEACTALRWWWKNGSKWCKSVFHRKRGIKNPRKGVVKWRQALKDDGEWMKERVLIIYVLILAHLLQGCNQRD